MSEIKKYRYIFALVLTVLIFILGVLGSNLVDDKRQAKLQNSLQDDTIDLQSKQLLMRYLEDKESCKLRQKGLNEIIEGYNNRLQRVQSYEERSFFQESEFQNIRRSYVLSGIEYWMFAEQIEASCESYDTNTILFFTEEDCKACERQGQVLSDIKRIYGDDVLIFSVYTGIDDSMINLLEKQFEVKNTPTLVVNKNQTLYGVHSRSNITDYLQINKGNSTE